MRKSSDVVPAIVVVDEEKFVKFASSPYTVFHRRSDEPRSYWDPVEGMMFDATRLVNATVLLVELPKTRFPAEVV